MKRLRMVRRFWIPLLVVGTALVISVPAFAAKGGIPGPPPNDDPPVEGLTCSEAFDGYGGPAYKIDGPGDQTVTLNRTTGTEACFDITTGGGDLVVNLDAENSGATSVTMILRDSWAPGDTCWIINDRVEIPATYVKPILQSVADACGEVYADSADSLVLYVYANPGRLKAIDVTVTVP